MPKSKFVGTTLATLATLGALSLGACQDEPTPAPPVDDRKPILAELPPPSISGGTMVLLDDGRVLVADADRARVHIVSISPPRFEADVLFEDGAEPGRSVEGSAGLAHVILRGTGDLATFDTSTGEVFDRRHLCTDPRGVAYDGGTAQLFVTCSDGNLLTLPELGGDVTERRFIEPDLRDILIQGESLMISRLRSAEIIEVPKSDLGVIGRSTPPIATNALPTVAWRMIEVNDNEIAMLHQYSATTEVAVTDPGEDSGGDFGEEGGGAPYGGGHFCEPAIVSPGITTWAGGEVSSSRRMGGPTPVVDMAVSSDGTIAVAVAGAPEGQPDVRFPIEDDFCFEGGGGITTPGQPVSVAYLPDGRLLVQSREPSALYVYGSTLQHELTFELSGESRFDTGHDLYHRSTPSSIACASCHPEATDDGHVWTFQDLGPRKTQSPEVGLEGSAPFHWGGDIDDFQHLTNEVYTHRMGGMGQSDARAAAFQRWIFSAERPPSGTEVDADLSAEGEQLFNDFGCASCHSGSRFTNNRTVLVRNEPLQVPSLRRVALHPPFMHDGRSPDLRSAVFDMLDATATAPFTGSDIDAITEYLRTL